MSIPPLLKSGAALPRCIGAADGPLGPYDIISRIGQGAMAETFLAERSEVTGAKGRVCFERLLDADQDDSKWIAMFQHGSVLPMALFGPTRPERLEAAARALAPYGFTMDPRAANEVRRYFPSSVFSAPDEGVTAVLGQVDGCQVEAYEYDYSYRDSDGNAQSASELLLVAHHPAIEGGASFTPDHPKWGGAAAVLDILFWVPPFTLLKAFQLLASANNPDRQVGHAQFDRSFVVRAESDQTAARAITPALREAVVRLGMKMSVELRPGHLVCSPHGIRLDENAASTIGIAVGLLSAYSRGR